MAIRTGADHWSHPRTIRQIIAAEEKRRANTSTLKVATDARDVVDVYLEQHHSGIGGVVVARAWDGQTCEVQVQSTYAGYLITTMRADGWTVDGSLALTVG